MARKLADSDGLRRHDRTMLALGATLGYRLTEPEHAECYFCDRTNLVDSLEHIVPKWLHDALGLNGKTFEPVYTNMGVSVHERGSIPATQLVASGICRECNTGWMSRLESAFAPMHRRITEVDPSTVAHWFVKTAFVLNVTQNTRLLVPRPMRLALASGVISNQVSVFLHEAAIDDQIRFNWVQNPLLPPMIYPSSREDAAMKSMRLLWSCTINLDGLVATVVVNPPGDSYASSWERLGRLLVHRGKVRNVTDLVNLPRLRFWGNGSCLVPAFMGSSEARDSHLMEFPEFRNFGDMMAYNKALTQLKERDPNQPAVERARSGFQR